MGAARQTFRGDAKYRNRRLMIGVKTMEQNRNPQKPMRRSRPTIPATRHSTKYSSTSSTTIVILNWGLRFLSRPYPSSHLGAFLELCLEIFPDFLGLEVKKCAAGLEVLDEYFA